jgi:geranylgeranyl pyrophosphate synthase
MHAGQLSDLALTDSACPDPKEVEASVIGKTGEGYAMYCALGARLAGAEPARVAAFAEIGLALGTAFQLVSDCHDLFSEGESADLRAGTRTLPVALHLHGLRDPERQEFLLLLREARTAVTAQQPVRRRLREGGALRISQLFIETYKQRARRALNQAAALEPWRGELAAMIESVALVPARTN